MLLKLCAIGPFVSFLDHVSPRQDFLHHSRIRWGDWHLVPSAAAILSTVGFLGALFVVLAPCPPLFEEESGARRQALAVDLVNPLFFDRRADLPLSPPTIAQWMSPRSTAPTDPIRGSKEMNRMAAGALRRWSTRLTTSEFRCCGAEPDIGKDVAHLRGDERRHSFGSLGEDLIIVAGSLAHDPPNPEDEFVADTLVK